MFTNLVSLEGDLFHHMPRLTYLQVAAHGHLREFPALSGVPQLRNLVLAELPSLQHVPALDHVPNLRQLELIYLPQAKTLPGLSRAASLVHVTAFLRCAFCCNGFLGECDPSNSKWVANAQVGIPQVPCLGIGEPRASDALLSVAQKFPYSFCGPSSTYDTQILGLDPEAVRVCGGVPYRRCEFPAGSGQIGMCYNTRMEVLSCLLDDDLIRLRRAQIAHGIGPLCDPVEETWLGCM